jgi:hypothetical protein
MNKVTDILSLRIAATNHKYKKLLDEIRWRENKIRELIITQLNLENEISALDHELEELELQAIKDLNHAGNFRQDPNLSK